MRKKREKKESKENKILKRVILVSIIGSIIFISILKYTYPNLSYSEWYSILASFVAGVLGGVITLITVYITLLGNESQEYNKIKKDMQLKACNDIREKINISVQDISSTINKRECFILQNMFAEKVIFELDPNKLIQNINIILDKCMLNRVLLFNIEEDFQSFQKNVIQYIECINKIEKFYLENSSELDKDKNSEVIFIYQECMENIKECLEKFNNSILQTYYQEILSSEIQKYEDACAIKEFDEMNLDLEVVGVYEFANPKEKYANIQRKMQVIGINI